MHPIIKKLRHLVFLEAAAAMRQAIRRPLQAEDLPQLPQLLEPEQAPSGFATAVAPSGPAFLYRVGRLMGRELSKALSLGLGYATCTVATPILVYKLVEFVSLAAIGHLSMRLGLGAGLLLCLSGTLTALFQHHYIQACLNIVQRVTSGLNMRLYQHSLRLTRKARQARPTGDIINLMGTDTDMVATAMFAGLEFTLNLAMILAASAMLIALLGWAGVSGLATLLLLVPLSRKIVQRFVTGDAVLMGLRDRRVSLVSQMLAGIRIVKYFAWEPPLHGEVQSIRTEELAARRRLFKNNALSQLVYTCGSLLVGLVSFATALAFGKTLTAALLFSCLAIFGLLDRFVASLSDIIGELAAARVSADRLAAFLREPILTLRIEPGATDSSPGGLLWEDVTYRYEDAPAPVLDRLRLRIQPGEAVAIVGAVGSGKSSLLLGLLGEVPISAGAFTWTDLPAGQLPLIAYVPQEAFIVSGTLLDNIRLGRGTASAADVEQALYATCLDYDIRQFAGGLAAEIGEQGLNLSGGQKQRVNLARAVVRDAGTILLDDPLSAVDFETEDRLVDRLLFGVWSGKTRIVVTHRMRHLRRFDRVIFIDQGKLVDAAPVAELLQRCPAFRRFYTHLAASEGEVAPPANPTPESARTHQEEANRGFVRLTGEEDRVMGGVKGAVYRLYGQALLGKQRGRCAVIVAQLAAASLLAVTLPVAQNSWLAFWSNQQQGATTTSKLWQELPASLHSAYAAIGLWGSIGALAILAAVTHQLLWLRRALTAGAQLHNDAFAAVLRAPLRFFDSTPVGRILNRFSRDVDAVEREVAVNLERTLIPVFHAVAAIALLSVTVPWLILAVIPALGLYYDLQRKYRHASRDA